MKSLLLGLVVLPLLLATEQAQAWDLKMAFRGKSTARWGQTQIPKDKVETLAGGISSGGGTVVERRPGEQPELIDFLLVDDRFMSQREATMASTMIPNYLGPYVPKLGYDHVKKEHLLASSEYQIAVRRIKSWSKNSPVVSRMMLQEISTLRFSFTDRDLNFDCVDRRPVALLDQYPNANINVASIYHTYFGAVINYPIYARMGVESRAGILIHETWRKLQISYKQNISNQTIWEVTAALMLGDPSTSQVKLDSHPGLGQYVAMEADIHYGDVVVAEICGKAKKNPSLTRTNDFCNGKEAADYVPPKERFPRHFDPYKQIKDTRSAEQKAVDAEERKTEDRIHDISARAESDWHRLMAFDLDSPEDDKRREAAYEFVQYINSVQLQRAVTSFDSRTRHFQQAFLKLAQIFAPFSTTGENWARQRIDGTLRAEHSSDQGTLERSADHIICALSNGFDAAMELSYCPANTVPTFKQFDTQISHLCERQFPVKEKKKSSSSRKQWK